MIKLMRSVDCGYSYREYATAENVDGLGNKMAELDHDGLRWYLEDEDGEQLSDYPCEMHKAILRIFGVEIGKDEGKE